MPSKSPILMLFELIDGISPSIRVVFDANFEISGISPSIYQIGYQGLYIKT